MFTLAPLFLFAASAVAQTEDPPSIRESSNGEFLTRNYPPGALKRREQGKVSFSLEVDEDGRLTSCKVTGTSGFAKLDSETCDFIIKYAKFKPARNAENRTVPSVRQGYVDWQLPRWAGKPASSSLTAAFDPQEKVCRSYVRTGSKVGRIKQCMTRQEWALRERITQDEARRMQDPGGGCATGAICN